MLGYSNADMDMIRRHMVNPQKYIGYACPTHASIILKIEKQFLSYKRDREAISYNKMSLE